MRTQRFGIEIEMTGITREKAAEAIAEYFGTESFYIGTYYKTYGAKDRQGRTWKATFDSSIIAQKKSGGRTMRAADEYKCEVVSPIPSHAGGSFSPLPAPATKAEPVCRPFLLKKKNNSRTSR